jgi:hypothetical protein
LIFNYDRKRVLPYVIVISSLFGIFGLYSSLSFGLSVDYSLILSIYFILIGVVLPIIILIGWQNMTLSGYEELFVSKVGDKATSFL